MDVTQTHVGQGLELLLDLGDILEQRKGVGNGHVKQVRDARRFVLDGQRFRVVAAPAAHLAGNEHVGQEIHLDAPQSFALARLAAPARHIE